MDGILNSEQENFLEPLPPSSSVRAGARSGKVKVVTRIRPLLQHETSRRSSLTAMEIEEGTSEIFSTPLKTSSSPTNFEETPLIKNKLPKGEETHKTKPFRPNELFSFENTATAKRITVSKDKMQRDFLFDAVFGPNSSQKEIYETSVGDAVGENIFRGYNTTILAYGQSGSGKTFTMFGQKEADKMAPSPDGSTYAQSFKFDKSSDLGNSVSAEEGIIPRAINDLFSAKQRHEKEGKVTIRLNFLELYNDELRDLMVDGESDLKIRDSGDDGFFAEGLTSIAVKSAEHARDLIDTACTRRRTASTKLNMRSSRSHAICTLTVSTELVSAKLTMVDLAGSERIKQTGVSKMAQKESININKDLFVLAKVISALADKSNQKRNVHVPYRDSKLTSLLRDSLGDTCFEESMNTLRYAERTKTITNSIKQNVLPTTLSATDCAALRAENRLLKATMLNLRKRISLLEVDGRDGSLYSTDSFEALQALKDDLYMSMSGETAASTFSGITRVSRKNQNFDEAVEGSFESLERLNRTLSESASIVLRSKGSLIDKMSSVDQDVFEPKSEDIIRGEQRIAKALKGENDKLRKDNKDLMDSKFAMEAQAKNLEQVVVSVRDEIKEAEVKLESLRHDVALMEERLQGTQPDVSTFRHRLHAYTAPARDIEMSVISRKLDTIAPTTKDEDLRSSLDLAKVELSQSQRMLESKSERVDELEKRELSFREEISALQVQLTNERKLRQQCETHLQVVSTESERLQRVCDELRMSAAIQQDEKENILGSLQAKEALIEEMREELRKSQAIVPELDVAHENFASVAEEANESFCDSDSRDSSLDLSTLRVLMNPNQPLSSTHIDIRAHAAKMLQFANRAIEKGRSNRSAVSSVVSSVGSEFMPIATKEPMSVVKSVKVPKAVPRLGKPPLPSRPNCDPNDNQQVVISNMEKVEDIRVSCICQDSLFSGNGEHVEFYLPKLGMACTCGNHKKETSTLDGPDPTALSNILRPWQVEFLSTLNLRNGVDLVHAFNQRGGEMAKAMRKWRKDKKLPSVKTKSCGVALHIWSTTCKAVVKSVRKEKSKGVKVFTRPDFLEVTSNVDGRTVSTLGCGSMIDMNAEFLEV